MMQSQIILYTVKLVLGGIAAFLAIMLWSKTRDIAWMALVAGTVTSYGSIVYEMFSVFGIIKEQGISIFGIPLATLLFTVIPSLFYIFAFIMMIFRSSK